MDKPDRQDADRGYEILVVVEGGLEEVGARLCLTQQGLRGGQRPLQVLDVLDKLAAAEQLPRKLAELLAPIDPHARVVALFDQFRPIRLKPQAPRALAGGEDLGLR